MEYILWRIVGVPGWRPDAEYGKGRERMREALDAFEQSAFRVQSPWAIKNPNGDNPNEE